MKTPAWYDKLKIRWGIKRNIDVLLILVVFSVTGSASLFVADWILPLFGITDNTPAWLRIPVRIILVFPSYNVILLIVGFLFGQFSFFWNQEKKMFKFFGRIFS